jgi:hypothetical protein
MFHRIIGVQNDLAIGFEFGNFNLLGSSNVGAIMKCLTKVDNVEVLFF